MHWKLTKLSGCGVLICVASYCLSPAEVRAQSEDAQQVAWQGTALAPKAFRVAAKKIYPSLVTIESFGGVSASQGRIGGIRKQGEGNTTGVVISADGYVVTSTFNFIKKPPIITVITSDGKRHVAEMMGKDETRQICVLKIRDVNDLIVPDMLPVNELKVGQWAVSVGVGYGDANPAISAGIISAKNRIGGRAVQTDANVSPANYGGPLIDMHGRLIGICVPLSPNSQAAGAGVEWYDSGIGFAIPMQGADQLIATLKSGKDIRAAWLGIMGKPPTGGELGVRIDKVLKDSPADQAGLKSGDVIIKFSGEPIGDINALRGHIKRLAEGDQAQVTVKRGDEELDLQVTFAAAPANLPADIETPPEDPEKQDPEKEEPEKDDSKKEEPKDEPAK